MVEEATDGYLVRFRANAQARCSRCPFFTHVGTGRGPLGSTECSGLGPHQAFAHRRDQEFGTDFGIVDLDSLYLT